jgi:hypothetical protein
MLVSLRSLALLGLASLFGWCHAEELSTRSDPVGKLLNELYAAKKCAGFSAIQYENRDGNHSPLDAGIYPPLKILAAPQGDPNAIGLATVIRPMPTFMNCSMASNDIRFGSLPRSYFHIHDGYQLLAAQYLGNQLAFYPEHHDFDPGINGSSGGHGDLYATNSPCLLISQGSSGSDQPFLRAFLATAAAFTPEVQQRLIETKLLMPTLQAIFRQSSPLAKTEADYLTGKAHPPVFDLRHLDEMAMVTRAQLMTPLSIPPVALLEVVEEPTLKAGVDSFDPPAVKGQVLGTSPANVARVYRSTADGYRITLSSKRSADAERRPLRLSWQVLQGDPQFVDIQPQQDGHSARIRVRWHNLPPTDGGLQTHRVDVGLFANNGLATSAPAIFSLYLQPTEQRFYNNQASLSEVCYCTTATDLGLPKWIADTRWLGLLQPLALPEVSSFQQVLDRVFTNAHRIHARSMIDQLLELQTKAKLAQADTARPQAATQAQQALQAAITAAMSERLEDKDGQTKTFQAIADRAINAIADFAPLYPALQNDTTAAAARSPKTTALADITRMVKRLMSLRVLRKNAQEQIELFLAKEEPSPAERHYLRQLNACILSQAFLPELLDRSPDYNTHDPRITSAKEWRDLYHYDDKGQRTGWTRYLNGIEYEFTADGQLKDGSQNRPVSYMKRGDIVEQIIERSVTGPAPAAR